MREAAVIQEKPRNILDISLNIIVDLEGELKRLRKRLKSNEEKISEDDIDRLKYIKEELRAIESE